VASHPGIVIRLLTWNLFHGRDAPPDESLHTWRSRLLRNAERGETHVQVNHSLRRAFLRKLAEWEWDVALLQEVPPRWFADLERATGASGWRALTSRNSFAALRAQIADRNPDLIASAEGGSNAILVRAPLSIVAAGRLRLALRPERRVSAMARLSLPGSGPGLVVASAHLSVPASGRGTAEALRAAEVALRWAGTDPVVLGGDLNLRLREHPEAFEQLRDRFGLAAPTGPRALDHLLVRGLDVVAPPVQLPAVARELPGPDGLSIRLSDHAPVTGAFRLR
jgi:endonuclease/exonuclease/phosphatase family metal-dependent hydrolase